MNTVLRNQEERNNMDALVVLLCTGTRTEECGCWGCAFIGDVRQEHGRQGLQRLRAAFDANAAATTRAVVDKVRAAMDDAADPRGDPAPQRTVSRDGAAVLRTWSRWLEAWVVGNKGDPDADLRGPHAEGYSGQ